MPGVKNSRRITAPERAVLSVEIYERRNDFEGWTVSQITNEFIGKYPKLSEWTVRSIANAHGIKLATSVVPKHEHDRTKRIRDAFRYLIDNIDFKYDEHKKEISEIVDEILVGKITLDASPSESGESTAGTSSEVS